MATVFVHRRVRPLRFAFLVNHRSADELRKAIQINTVLWGGTFNPIIEVFKRTPRSWATTRRATEIVRGYLDAFEPDFVVTGRNIDATTFGVLPTNAASLDGMLTREGFGEHGLGVIPVYRWRYEHELRFVQKDPVLLRRPSTAGPLGLFLSAIFGAFPPNPLEFFAQGFSDIGGETVDAGPESYLELLHDSVSPLDLSDSEIDQTNPSGPRRTCFLIDPRSTSDIIDFWNLRALGWRILAIPTGWAAQLAPKVSKMIREHYSHDDMLPSSYTRARLLKGRAVTQDRLTAFAESLAAPPNTTVLQMWLPRIWESEVREADQAVRAVLSAKEEQQEVQSREEWLSFRTIGPQFADKRWGMDRARFANVIHLRSYELPTLANVIPKEITNLDNLLRWMGPPDMIRNSSEGVSVLTDCGGYEITWRIPHGLRVFTEWLKPKGEIQLSGAGKIANRLIGIVGGPNRARMVTDVELVRLFGRASDTASRDVSHEELFGLFKKLHDNRDDIAERRIEAMIRQKVVRLGMRLKCEQCGQQNWRALDELREVVPCQWCLDELRFPTARPPRQPCWSYRPLGPFGAKGHAQGAYVVAAAIHVLRELGGTARTAWLPSFTMKAVGGELEADFGVLWDGNASPRNPQLLLGECKTFGEFEAKDIQRMKRLAKAFPQAVIVLATFTKEITPAQRKLIAPFAEWGRRNWRSPVMVLTARELTSDSGMPYCWHHGGDEREQKMYQAVVRAPAPHVSLRRLADATQQLHLHMTAGENWPHYEAP